jgi:putative ABC transport system ATP-binding protein
LFDDAPAVRGPPMTGPLLRVEGLAKHYGPAAVFEQVSLQVEAGEFVALLGESGVGKSTLLNALAGLDTVDAGRIELEGQDVRAMDDRALAELRRGQLGFVFQAFHVLPHLTVADNVVLPLLLLGRPDAPRVAAMLGAVGLDGLGGRMPAQLSGGQLQRVAIARALVHRPRLVLADEPTGNLDPRTADRVMSLLAEEVRRERAACVMVTHSAAAAARADRVLRLTPTGLIDAGHEVAGLARASGASVDRTVTAMATATLAADPAAASAAPAAAAAASAANATALGDAEGRLPTQPAPQPSQKPAAGPDAGSAAPRARRA